MKPVANHANSERLYRFAKTMRRQPTRAEGLLWHHLRMLRQPTGLKFRRQQPVAPYIVDFACFAPRMVIEIDGLTHDNELAVVYDKKRDEDLCRQGFHILRFADSDVRQNVEAVVETILAAVLELRKPVLA